MGRIKKPTAIKKAKGTYRPDKEVGQEPIPESWEDHVPEELTGFAEREWRRVVPQLKRMEVLTKIDASMLVAYCIEYGKYLKYEEELAKGEAVITLPNGLIQANPYVSLSLKALKNAKDIAVHFGFTPSSRSKIDVSKKEPEDNSELAKIMKVVRG